MSAEKFGLHITDAVIIGDQFKTGQLFYEGRAQGGQFHGDTDAELRAIAQARKGTLRAQLGAEYTRLYPLPIWELRIWD